MSFITESRKAYKKVQEAEDHEISMARGELEAIADKATQLASMLQGKSDDGNPLEAWVQSKITKAKDYINSVSDYMMYNPKINESFELEETTFEKIYQMQQDGKSAEDIAKELKLKPDLVKKVLGESKVISEGLSDAQIAQLKKEYEPLKGKTITTSQYQQLKNILFKLQDGDLEKLQKQNIPFASTGAGSILRVRKSPVKITSVKVPGLEGMAEEKIPQDYLDYLRTIVLKNVDFYEVPPKQIIQSWRDEKNKDRFKGKMVDYKEAVDMSKVTKYKMISIKGDQKEITIDREDLEKHLKLGYVIKEPLTEESDKGYNVKYKMKKDDASISMSWYKDKELAQKFLDDVKKSGGNGIITAKEEAELKEGAKRYKEMSNVGTAKYVVSFHDGIKKHNDGSDFFDVEIFKNKEEKNKFITDLDRKGYRPIKYVDEEVSKEKENEFHKKLDTLVHKTFGSSSDEKKKQEPKKEEVKEPTGDLKDACWTGYVAVGTKMKNGKRVPNCVPKSEAYKGAKAIVENAFKKLKEKK